MAIALHQLPMSVTLHTKVPPCRAIFCWRSGLRTTAECACRSSNVIGVLVPVHNEGFCWPSCFAERCRQPGAIGLRGEEVAYKWRMRFWMACEDRSASVC